MCSSDLEALANFCTRIDVVITTENGIDHISRAMDGGANEYIMKPFDKDIITAKFQEVGLIELTEESPV